MQSLFERLGGADALEVAVTKFYWKMLTDDRVSHFFEGKKIGRQIVKQKAFLTMVTGGPNNYQGKDLRAGHRHLVEAGLNDTHVDAVIEHLGATLRELDVGEEDVQAVLELADSCRNDILGR